MRSQVLRLSLIVVLTLSRSCLYWEVVSRRGKQGNENLSSQPGVGFNVSSYIAN
jgi:hypothetical protein